MYGKMGREKPSYKNDYFDSLVEESKGIKPIKKEEYKRQTSVQLKATPIKIEKKENFFSKAGKVLYSGGKTAVKFIAKESGEAIKERYGQYKDYRREKNKALYRERVKQMRKRIRENKTYAVDNEWSNRKRDERWLK